MSMVCPASISPQTKSVMQEELVLAIGTCGPILKAALGWEALPYLRAYQWVR